MMTIEEKLTLLEEVFEKHIDGKYDEAKFCKELGVILSSMDRKYSFDVMVSNHNKKELFYGMRIFPAGGAPSANGSGISPVYHDEISLMLNAYSDEKVSVSFNSCYERWKNQDKWVLEIDAGALNHREIILFPKELVAMLLHELGHVVYSEKTLERIYNAFMDMKVAQTTSVKYTMKSFDYLFYPVILAACKMRRWVVGKDEMNIELFADKNAVKYGYGEYLESAFVKVIKTYGRTDNDTDTPSSAAKWGADMVTALTARHNRVGKELYVRAARSSSRYIQTLYRSIMVKLGMSNRNRYSGAITPDLPAIESLFAEDYIEHNELFCTLESTVAIESMYNFAVSQANVAMEAFGKKSARKYEQDLSDLEYALDTICIDIESANSSYEKKNIIDRLYSIEEELSEWKERLDQFPHLAHKYSQRVNRISENVKKFREETLSKKIVEKKYGVFVKYPVGYEG